MILEQVSYSHPKNFLLCRLRPRSEKKKNNLLWNGTTNEKYCQINFIALCKLHNLSLVNNQQQLYLWVWKGWKGSVWPILTSFGKCLTRCWDYSSWDSSIVYHSRWEGKKKGKGLCNLYKLMTSYCSCVGGVHELCNALASCQLKSHWNPSWTNNLQASPQRTLPSNLYIIYEPPLNPCLLHILFLLFQEEPQSEKLT